MRYTLLLSAVLVLTQVTGSYFDWFGDFYTTETGLGTDGSTSGDPHREMDANYFKPLDFEESFDSTEFFYEDQENISTTNMPPSIPPLQEEIGPVNAPHSFGQSAAQDPNIHRDPSGRGIIQTFPARFTLHSHEISAAQNPNVHRDPSSREIIQTFPARFTLHSHGISVNHSSSLSIPGHNPTSVLQPLQQSSVESNNAGKDLSRPELNEMLALGQWFDENGNVGANLLDPPLRRTIPSTETDWFDGPVIFRSNVINRKIKKWQFGFKRQSVLAPSYIDFEKIGRNATGITGRSDKFNFMVRPSLIIFTEGQQESPLMKKSYSYNRNLITAINEDELETKATFGIEQGGLCVILEGGTSQARLYVRAIGKQLPVALKVMRRNKNRWESVLESVPGEVKYCDITGDEVVVIGEPDEIRTELSLPTESPDLWNELGAMTESPFRFLISAQLMDSRFPFEKSPIKYTNRSVFPTVTIDQDLQTDSTRVEQPREPNSVGQGPSYTVPLDTGEHGIVNNACNIHGTTQNEQGELQRTEQPMHPRLLPPATSIATDQHDMPLPNGSNEPSTVKDWFKGTWESMDYKMARSHPVKMSLLFKQHSARAPEETRPKKAATGIEGKGDLFGFRLRPSFLAIYDGAWIHSDRWIAQNTKGFTKKVGDEDQTLFGCQMLAKALLVETLPNKKLGIKEDGIFALLVASGDETMIQVRMTENSLIALRVLRPVDGTYEIVTSSVPGELVSCPVEEGYIVIMGQSSEMELLGKLGVEDSSKSLLDQLSEDHFWTVSILSKQKATPTSKIIGTSISPPTTASINNSSNQTVATRHSIDLTDAPIDPLPLQGNQSIHDFRNVTQNGPQETRQSVSQSTPPATPAITDQHDMSLPNGSNEPSTVKDWFKGTWKSMDYKMIPSRDKVKMPLAFRQHSARAPEETRPEKDNIGIEGKGDLFGFRLRPSFLAIYDGAWIHSDTWIARNTKGFTERIGNEDQTSFGYQKFAKALLMATLPNNELGIKEDGIFALLVASGDETMIRVRMTENSLIALRVLRPVDGTYEIVTSSVPGELASCSVEEGDIVIMGQSSEMELLGKLEVEDSPKSLLDQLSEDHFWTVSILSKQQTVHSATPRSSRAIQHSQSPLQANQPIDDNLESQTAVNDGSVTNQSLAPPQEEAGWFHEPLESSSYWVAQKIGKWPFNFRNQFILAPSYVDLGKIGRNGNGISGKSHQFSFIMKPGFIVFTEGHRENFTGQTNSYNLGLVKAIKGSELESKKSFGIEQNGLCAILETIKDQKDGTRMYLHVRVIGQIPVTLKVMHRNKDRWEAIPTSEELGNLKSYKVMEGDILIIGETAEMEVEQNFPIESDDLFSELKRMAESSFHFLILAQLVDSRITKEEFIRNLSRTSGKSIEESSNTKDKASSKVSNRQSSSTKDKASSKASGKTSSKVSNRQSSSTKDKISSKVSNRQSSNTKDKASSKVSNGKSPKASDKASSKVSNSKSSNTKDKASSKVSNSKSSNTKDKVSSKVSDKTSSKVSNSKSSNTKDKTSSKVSNRQSSNTKDKASSKASNRQSSSTKDKTSSKTNNRRSKK